MLNLVKILAFVVLAILASTANGLTFRKEIGRVEAGAELLETNALGELIIKFAHDYLETLEDPLLLIDNITLPVFLNDTIYVEGDINATDVYVTGFKGLNFTDCIANLVPPNADAVVGIRLPDILVTGDYEVGVLVTSIFPIPLEGAGPFSLELSELQLDVNVQLESFDGTHFQIIYLSFEIDIYKIWGVIEGLFTGVDDGELNEAVNKVFNAYATILFNLFEAQYHEDVHDLIVLIANEFLENWPPEGFQ